jgi:hypothetical protein
VAALDAARLMSGAFTANFISVDEDDDCFVVELADEPYNASRRLVLQRTRAPSALDVELGLDGYHVEVDDQTQSCHGGIESFELFPDRVEVTFEEDAVETLGGEQALLVRFTIREKQLAQLRGCLGRIFAGDACFVDMCAG